MIRQGEIYLVDFGKKYHSELGKIRPAVVLQNDLLNRALEETPFKGVVVVPLTTDLCGGDYRLAIGPRDKLEQESEAVANWVCTMDLRRFDSETGPLTRLTPQELDRLVETVGRIFTQW